MHDTAPAKYLKYIPPPERPFGFDKKLKSLVGLSPNGTDLYLRFIWGMDSTEILDGQIVRRYPDPNGQYVGVARWILEGWQASDVYDETEWRANEDLMGPWPINGMWDYIATVEDKEKRYLPLGSHALQMARNWRLWKSKTHKRVLQELLERRCELQVLKEKQWAARKKEIMDQFLTDFTRAAEGTHDPRNRQLVGKITKGEYQESPTGILIPKFAQ